ncbi:hypothetical protein J4558_14825 [Leptolyngbya sp. 15MV]|nr:hypothetical protein J4558_14825 [Leptolyngbya sp. 15MV]
MHHDGADLWFGVFGEAGALPLALAAGLGGTLGWWEPQAARNPHTRTRLQYQT